MNWSRVCFYCFLASFAVFVFGTYINAGFGWGRLDADMFWGAGLAIRHGTFKFIYEVPALTDPRTWKESVLFVQDAEVFRSIVRWPGYLVPYIYPPPWAMFWVPISYLPQQVMTVAWAVVSTFCYLFLIWKNTRRRWLFWIIAGIALHFRYFQLHLLSGNSTLAVAALALYGGPAGIAIAAWTKLYPIVIMFAARNWRRVLAWCIVIGIAAWIAIGFETAMFWKWIPLAFRAQEYTHYGHIKSDLITYARVITALTLLIIGLFRNWNRAVILWFAQCSLPTWWMYYWCLLVPVVAVAMERLLDELQSRARAAGPSFRAFRLLRR